VYAANPLDQVLHIEHKCIRHFQTPKHQPAASGPFAGSGHNQSTKDSRNSLFFGRLKKNNKKKTLTEWSCLSFWTNKKK
jgi:hypothetical protein